MTHDPMCTQIKPDYPPSECWKCVLIARVRADEWEQIAQQFRMAYQLGACDPSNCPECDCNMDDAGRAQLAGLALQQAQAVIRIIHDGEVTP